LASVSDNPDSPALIREVDERIAFFASALSEIGLPTL